MNIGIDMDETAMAMPEFFAVLAKAFRTMGHKVFIVSFREPETEPQTERELETWNIEHDGVFHPSDNSEGFAEFKGRMAHELDLDIFFDDMPEAFDNMPEKTHRLWLCDPRVYDMPLILKQLGTSRFKFY